jgi:hypothetical protein
MSDEEKLKKVPTMNTTPFGERPRVPRSSSANTGAVPRLISQYCSQFKQRHGIKPLVNGGKDGWLLKRMVATWGEDVVSTLLTEFIASDNRWAQQRGWTIATFFEVAQVMVTRRTRSQS